MQDLIRILVKILQDPIRILSRISTRKLVLIFVVCISVLVEILDRRILHEL